MYDIWQNPVANELVQTFSVITVPANELCRKIHNGGKNPGRMPLIISRKNEGQWIDCSLVKTKISNFFRPFRSDLMDAYPIQRDFLKKGEMDKTVIEAAETYLHTISG